MSRAQALALLVVLILAGLALRLYRLDAFSFRGDEAFTVLNWVSRPLLKTLNSEIALKDPQPPLAFALFRGWALLFGTGEIAMRLLPALGSLIGIAGMYALGHRVGGRGSGLAAAAMLAIHPFVIWHAQDAKAYVIWVAASSCAAWLALRALKRNRLADWLLYLAAAFTAAWLYYLELFLLACLNIHALVAYRKQTRTLRHWMLAQLALALMLAPWYLQERLLFGSGYGGTAGPLEPLRLVTWLLPALQFGRSLPGPLMERSAMLVAFVLLAGLWFMARRDRRMALFAGLCAFLPPLLLGLAALRLNVFTPRYVLASVPACILLFVELGGALWRRGLPTRILALAVAGAWLGLMLLSLNNAWFNPEFAKSPDWRGLARYLAEETAGKDLVVLGAADEAFTLYHAEQTDFLRLPASAAHEADEILAALRSASGNYDSIWLVADAPAAWPNRRVAADWLEENLQLIRETRIDTLPVRQYRSREVQADEVADAPLAVFPGVAALMGVRQGRTPEALVVELVWRAPGPSDLQLKAFVHLYDERGPAGGSPLLSQDDRFIQDFREDASGRTPGDLMRGVHALPLVGVPPGDHVLHVGLYDPVSGRRVPDANGADSAVAGQVSVTAPRAN